MKRGAVVLAAGPGDYSGKPRPFVVVQSNLFNDAHDAVSLCPVTSILLGNHLFRIPLAVGSDTGLDRDSEIQVDKIQALRRARLVRRIGTVPQTAMTQVDDALRRWLAL